ncbi:MAG TPA: hypothetical protein VGH38_13080 [Bryobacteraceae bacterium]
MRIARAERLDRFAHWLQRRNERPLLGFTLGSYYPLHRYPNGTQWIPEGPVHPDDIHVVDYLEDSDKLFELHEAAGGDFVWSAAPFWGVPWVEASLGCGVLADHTVGSMRATPPPGFAQNPVVPEFSETNCWVAKLLEFIPALLEHSAGRYPVGTTLMRGVADLLSALYGGENFVLRMVDEPDEVHAVIKALTRYWIAFGRCMLDRLPLFHGGTGSFLLSLWCPGKMIWTQEDALALLSPALYEKFIYPADLEIACAFERTAMHLHPTRFIPIRHLMAARTDIIELHVDHDGPRAAALEPYYRAVLSGKPLLIWGDLTEADLDFVLTQLPHQGLAVNTLVSSVEEAQQIWDRTASLLRARVART